ncbi:hypothetical protein AAMO2058_001415600 [Amorphochlora amoebiformis]
MEERGLREAGFSALRASFFSAMIAMLIIPPRQDIQPLHRSRAKRVHPRSVRYHESHFEKAKRGKTIGLDREKQLMGSRQSTRSIAFYSSRYGKEVKDKSLPVKTHRIGGCVQLCSLINSRHMNGRIGVVRAYDKNVEKYHISLIPNRTIHRVSPQNLISKDFKVHQVLRIRNLTDDPQINNRAGGISAEVEMKYLEAGDLRDKERMQSIHITGENSTLQDDVQESEEDEELSEEGKKRRCQETSGSSNDECDIAPSHTHRNKRARRGREKQKDKETLNEEGIPKSRRERKLAESKWKDTLSRFQRKKTSLFTKIERCEKAQKKVRNRIPLSAEERRHLESLGDIEDRHKEISGEIRRLRGLTSAELYQEFST